jgi:hypothetical protein
MRGEGAEGVYLRFFLRPLRRIKYRTNTMPAAIHSIAAKVSLLMF